MFEQLNKEDGITIILVTHDVHVAGHARRLIHIHDGVIVNSAFSEADKPSESGSGFRFHPVQLGGAR